MDNKNIKFELLKYWGNIKEIVNLTNQQKMPAEQKTNHIAETYLYWVMNEVIWQDRYQNVRDDWLDDLLHPKEVRKFLRTTNNWKILTDFVTEIGDVLEEYVGMCPPMESYTPLPLLRILNNKQLSNAIIRGSQKSKTLKTAAKRTLKRGRQILFTNDIESDMFSEYYPMLKQYESFTKQTLETVVIISHELCNRLEEKENVKKEGIGIGGRNYEREFLELALSALYKLDSDNTDLVLYQMNKNRKGYKALVEEGIIKKPTAIDNRKTKRIKAILEKDHKETYPYWDNPRVDELQKAIEQKQDFSEKFGDWFKNGNMNYIFGALEFYRDKYDSNKARQSLGNAIAESIKAEDWDKLR